MARSLLEDVPEQTFTSETIKRMYRLVQQAVTDPAFQKLIYGLVNGAMPGKWKDYRGELSTVLNWFKRNVDYRRDPFGVELLQDVWATLDRGRGDCDDATVWICAAAQILGCPTRIVTVSTRPDKEPVHVYPEAMVGGRWLGLDATVPGSFVGWKPPHVTDTKVWTRKELGLSGDDDTSNVEGLGMTENDENWRQRDIYATDYYGTMTPVSDRLAPGVPDDVSKTDATGIPGTTNISKREIWRAPVANNSEWTSNPRPGGGVYGPALPVGKRPLPQDLWYLVDRKFVPKVLDPNSAWWGKVPASKEDLDRMFPGSEIADMSYLRDIASVPASAIAEVEDDVRTQLALGEIGLADVGDAIEEGLENYSLGRVPRMKLPAGQRPPRTKVGKGGDGKKGRPGPMPPAERRYLVPAPSKAIIRRGGHLNGLGDIFDDAAKAISSGVQTGQIPPSAVEQAVNTIVSAVTGQPIAQPEPAVSTANIAKSAIPIGMIALLAGAAWLMSGGTGKKKYKRNPSRRQRSRGRGRSGGGGFDWKMAALWGGGGLAAYYLFLRPGATFLPTTPAPKPAVATTGPISVAQQAAIAAGVKAAPSIFDSIAKLFSSSSTPSTVAPGASPSGFVTSYDQLYSQPAAAPADSGFRFDYT